MKNKKGFTIVELLAVIIILGILISVGTVSYITISKSVKESQYETKINLIKNKAIIYANENNLDQGQVSVLELVKEGYLDSDKSATDLSEDYTNIINPKGGYLDCDLIEFLYLDDDYKVEYKKNNDCTIVSTYLNGSNFNIKLFDEQFNEITADTRFWTNSEYVYVYLELNDKNLVDNKLMWSNKGTIVEKTGEILNREPNNKDDVKYINVFTYRASKYLNNEYNVFGNTEEGYFNANFKVRIDRVAPKVSASSDSTWTNSQKRLVFQGDDGDGSGIRNYLKLTKPNDSLTYLDFKGEFIGESLVNSGTYYIYAIDYAGNISEMYRYEVTNLDLEGPECVIIGENTTWTNSPVTITYGCNDDQSGCKTQTKQITFTDDIETTTMEWDIEDNSGHKTHCKYENFYIRYDKTPPKTPTVTMKYNGTNTNYSNDSWTNKAIYISASSEDVLGGAAKVRSGISQNSSIYKDSGFYYELTKVEYDSYGRASTKTEYTKSIDKVLSTQSTYTIKFRVRDLAGNWSPYTEIKKINIDTQAPVIKKISASYTDDSGKLQSYKYADWINKTVTTTPTAEDIGYFQSSPKEVNITYKYYHTRNNGYGTIVEYDKTNPYTSIRNSNGKLAGENWIDENTYVVYYQACDIAGNCSSFTKKENNYSNAKDTNIYIDKTAPRCETKTNHPEWTKEAVTLTGECFDDKSIYKSGCVGNSTRTINERKNESLSPPNIKDKAGNVSSCGFKQVKIDRDPPTVPTVTLDLSGGGSYTPNTWVNQTVNTSASSSETGSPKSGGITYYYTYSDNNASSTHWNNYGGNKSFTSSDTYTIKYKACDQAGNCSEDSKEYTVKVDKTPPTKPNGGTIGAVGGSDPTGKIAVPVSGSTDSHSGLAEYLYLVKNTPDLPSKYAGFINNTTFTRKCGTTYYAFAIAVDNVGNRSDVVMLGGVASDGPDEYSSYGQCSKTCGGGKKYRTNTCALVTTGLSKSCNTDACPDPPSPPADTPSSGGGESTKTVARVETKCDTTVKSVSPWTNCSAGHASHSTAKDRLQRDVYTDGTYGDWHTATSGGIYCCPG